MKVVLVDPQIPWNTGNVGRSCLGFGAELHLMQSGGGVATVEGAVDRPVALLHNQTKTEGNGLQFELVGTASERDAIGAHVVVTSGGTAAPPGIAKSWLAGREAVDGRPTAYICRGHSCSLPVGDPKNLLPLDDNPE